MVPLPSWTRGRLRRALLAAALCASPVVALADGNDAAGDRPDCVHAWGEARYGALGYDHYVHVRNGCDRAVRCDVSTDVNPTPTRVRVEAGRATEVLTFRGSPASSFRATAACELEP